MSGQEKYQKSSSSSSAHLSGELLLKWLSRCITVSQTEWQINHQKLNSSVDIIFLRHWTHFLWSWKYGMMVRAAPAQDCRQYVNPFRSPPDSGYSYHSPLLGLSSLVVLFLSVTQTWHRPALRSPELGELVTSARRRCSDGVWLEFGVGQNQDRVRR